MEKTIKVWGVVCRSKTTGKRIYAFTWPFHEGLPYVRYSFFQTKADANKWAKANSQNDYECTVVQIAIPAP